MIIVTIAGRIGKDAEQKTINSGSLCNFSLVADVGFGQNKQSAWFDCTLWGKRGEAVSQYITKGSSVTVIGELSFREHDGKTYNKVNVTEIALQGGSTQTAQAGYPEPAQQNTKPAGDIPF